MPTHKSHKSKSHKSKSHKMSNKKTMKSHMSSSSSDDELKKCMHCGKAGKVVEGQHKTVTTKKGRKMSFLIGTCSNCHKKISKILANSKA